MAQVVPMLVVIPNKFRGRKSKKILLMKKMYKKRFKSGKYKTQIYVVYTRSLFP
jgi:hypothetical protein